MELNIDCLEMYQLLLESFHPICHGGRWIPMIILYNATLTGADFLLLFVRLSVCSFVDCERDSQYRWCPPQLMVFNCDTMKQYIATNSVIWFSENLDSYTLFVCQSDMMHFSCWRLHNSVSQLCNSSARIHTYISHCLPFRFPICMWKLEESGWICTLPQMLWIISKGILSRVRMAASIYFVTLKLQCSTPSPLQNAFCSKIFKFLFEP